MRGKVWGYIWSVMLAVVLVLLLREAWHVAVDHVLLPDIKRLGVRRLVWGRNPLINFNLGIYWWFMVGFTIYPLLRWLLVKIRLFSKHFFIDIETMLHEMSHWLVGKLLGRRIHMFHTEADSGQVLSSGGQWSRPIMTLAPYSFPFLTFVLLAMRPMVTEMTWLFDLLIGLTFGMHFVCFATQTRRYQTDINRFATLWFPYLYIAVSAVFNFTVIAVSFWRASEKNFFKAIWWIISNVFTYPLC